MGGKRKWTGGVRSSRLANPLLAQPSLGDRTVAYSHFGMCCPAWHHVGQWIVPFYHGPTAN